MYLFCQWVSYKTVNEIPQFVDVVVCYCWVALQSCLAQWYAAEHRNAICKNTSGHF